MRPALALICLVLLCSCAARDPAPHVAGKYSSEAIRARVDQLTANPPELDEDEKEAIRSRMRVREMERFPLEE